jgi:hypothetical protein
MHSHIENHTERLRDTKEYGKKQSALRHTTTCKEKHTHTHQARTHTQHTHTHTHTHTDTTYSHAHARTHARTHPHQNTHTNAHTEIKMNRERRTEEASATEPVSGQQNQKHIAHDVELLRQPVEPCSVKIP